MSFLTKYQDLLEGGQPAYPVDYDDSLETLVGGLSALAAEPLRAMHATEYPFEIALRPFYYMFVFQFANAVRLGPSGTDGPRAPLQIDNLAQLFRNSLHGPLHAALNEIGHSEDPEGVLARILAPGHVERGSTPAGPGPAVVPSRQRRARLGVSLSLTAFEKLVLRALNPGRLRFIRPRPCRPYPLDGERRRDLFHRLRARLDSGSVTPEESRILLASAAFLPSYFLEGFPDHAAAAGAIADSLRGIVSGIEFQHHPQIALAIPLLKSRGRISVGTQHGGFYGQCDPTFWERIERYLFDRYATWGYEFSPGDVPMPSIRLSRPRPGHGWQRFSRRLSGGGSRSILVVLPYLAKELAYSTHSPGVERQEEALRRSLAMLEPARRKGYRLVLRAHPRNDPGEYTRIVPDSMGAVSATVPGTRGTLAADAHRFGRTLFTTPNATGISECIANHVPWGVVADPADFRIRPQAQELYRRLIDARVWLTSDRATDEFLDRPQEFKNARREAFVSFSRHYARRSRGYLWAWARFLREIHGEREVLPGSPEP